MKRIFFYFLATLLFQFGLFYAGDLETITAYSAVDLALRNDLTLKKMAQDVAIAEAQCGESTADLIPSVGLNANLTYYDPNTVSSSTVNYGQLLGSNSEILANNGIPSIITNIFPDNCSAGVTLTYQLPIPFTAGYKAIDTLGLREINLELAKKRYEDEKKEIVYNTLSAFYDLFLIKENILLFEDLDKSLSNQLKTITLSYQKGVASEYDRLSVEVEYENNKPKLTAAVNAYETAKLSFSESIGIDGTNVEFIGDLLDSTNISIGDYGENSALSAAYSNDINLVSLNYNLKIQKLAQSIDDEGKLPSFSAFANLDENYSKTNSFQNLRSWNWGVNVGIQFSMPVNEWLPVSKTANHAREDEAIINKITETRQQVTDNIKVQVDSLLSRLEVSKENMISAKAAVDKAKLKLDIADKGYSIGSSTIQDTIDSRSSYTQAQANWLQAVFDHYTSVLKLKRITGEIL